MEVRIKYTEIQEFIKKNFQKEVGLAYVDPSTVSVSTKIKVFAFVKNVGVDLKVEKLEGSKLPLVYSGKLGIELLISPAISFLKRLVPEKTNLISQGTGNKVFVNLAEIDKLKAVLDKVELQSISFDETHVIVEAGLKY
mgnify:FL=1